jgi:hypothetical protein
MIYLHKTGFPFKGYKETYHLFADTSHELHQFAKQLSLSRNWYQHHKWLPHYDIFGSKIEQAKRLGAIEVDDKHVMEIYKRFKGL